MIHSVHTRVINDNLNIKLSAASADGSNRVNQSSMNMMMKMMERGNIAMGFDQSKIAHRFIATSDGGKIVETALNSTDRQTIKEIKNHLVEIQESFLMVTLLNRSLYTHKKFQELRS